MEERREGGEVGARKLRVSKGIREAPEHLKLRTSRSGRLSGFSFLFGFLGLCNYVQQVMVMVIYSG